MPGRPRTTVKRLDDLIQQTMAINDKVFDLVPSRYIERDDASDPICAAWQAAIQATMEQYRSLFAPRELVAAKVARADRLSADGGG